MYTVNHLNEKGQVEDIKKARIYEDFMKYHPQELR